MSTWSTCESDQTRPYLRGCKACRSSGGKITSWFGNQNRFPEPPGMYACRRGQRSCNARSSEREVRVEWFRSTILGLLAITTSPSMVWAVDSKSSVERVVQAITFGGGSAGSGQDGGGPGHGGSCDGRRAYVDMVACMMSIGDWYRCEDVMLRVAIDDQRCEGVLTSKYLKVCNGRAGFFVDEAVVVDVNVVGDEE
jgi:hypothetical protein